VGVSVGVSVAVAVDVAVLVGVEVGVYVAVGVRVGVEDGVIVGVLLGVGVAVSVTTGNLSMGLFSSRSRRIHPPSYACNVFYSWLGATKSQIYPSFVICAENSGHTFNLSPESSSKYNNLYANEPPGPERTLMLVESEMMHMGRDTL